MPDKKNKGRIASLKGDDADTLILDYLVAQNRPYNVVDIVANLKNQVSKAHSQKSLASLEERKLISSKTYGKVTIYCALQGVPKVSKEDAVRLADHISSLKAKESAIRNFVAHLMKGESLIKSLNRELQTTIPTWEEAVKMKTRLKKKKHDLQGRVTILSQMAGSNLTIESNSQNIQKEIATEQRILNERKKVAREIEAVLMGALADQTVNYYRENKKCDNQSGKRLKVNDLRQALWDMLGGEAMD